MEKNLTDLGQFRKLALYAVSDSRNRTADLAATIAGALEEMKEKKQDAASAISMDKVNTAIREAVGTIETALSEV